MLAPGAMLAGKYRILKRIASGGMGVVYLGHHEHLDRPVAVKLVLPDAQSTAELAERFRREVRALGRIRSPYVAEAFDADLLDTGELYLAMEYLDGQDLRAEIRQRGKIPMAEAVTYVMQASRGAAAAHEAGVIHRDLKPQNLFLANVGELRRAKLVDFGIARLLGSVDPTLTLAEHSLGTPLYMSPEQIYRPGAVDARGDVWQLGVVLYELLAGFPAFADVTPGAILLAISLDDPVPLRDIDSAIPTELADIVSRALAKDPSVRIASAGQLAELLAPFALPEADLRRTVVSAPPRRPARAPLRPPRRRVQAREEDLKAYRDLVDRSARPSASLGVARDLVGQLTNECAGGAETAYCGERRLSMPSPAAHSLPPMLRASLPPSLRGDETIDAAPAALQRTAPKAAPIATESRSPRTPPAPARRAWLRPAAVTAVLALTLVALSRAQHPAQAVTRATLSAAPAASEASALRAASTPVEAQGAGKPKQLSLPAPVQSPVSPKVTAARRVPYGRASSGRKPPEPRASAEPVASPAADGNPLHL